MQPEMGPRAEFRLPDARTWYGGWCRTGLVLVAIVSSAACYEYIPVAETPAPGQRVRARLTIEGAVRQSELLGEPLRSVEGAVVEANGDHLALDVVRARGQTSFQNFVLKDTFLIPRNELQAVELRRLSTWRSVALGVGIGAAALLAIDRVVSAGGNETSDGGPGTGFAILQGSIRFGGR